MRLAVCDKHDVRLTTRLLKGVPRCQACVNEKISAAAGRRQTPEALIAKRKAEIARSKRNSHMRTYSYEQ